MLTRNIDEKIFKMIDELEKEAEEKNHSDYPHNDEIVPVIYNMFNLTEEQADIYYWMAITWTCSYKAWSSWNNIDFEIIHEDNKYICIAWWFNLELYVSLARCLQVLDRIVDILIEYEPD